MQTWKKNLRIIFLATCKFKLFLLEVHQKHPSYTYGSIQTKLIK
uniref:Uncharacterized protein n=1 Tax=Glycine max TaxID=3847 RepID=A0A0R0HMJ8_SOYBN